MNLFGSVFSFIEMAGTRLAVVIFRSILLILGNFANLVYMVGSTVELDKLQIFLCVLSVIKNISINMKLISKVRLIIFRFKITIALSLVKNGNICDVQTLGVDIGYHCPSSIVTTIRLFTVFVTTKWNY